MEEKQNRFIIFPETDEETEKQEEPAMHEEEMKSVVVGEENPVFNRDEEHSEAAVQEKEKSNPDLGDLGVVETDENGRIVFDDVSIPEIADDSSDDDSDSEISDVSLNNPAPVEEPLAEESVTKTEPILPEEESYEEEEISDYEESKINEFQTNRNLQDMINQILKIDALNPVEVDVTGRDEEKIREQQRQKEEARIKEEKDANFRQEIYDVVNEENRPVVFQSELLKQLNQKSIEENRPSILVRYGEDYCSKTFVTNPAIGREEEIRQLILTLLTPEKSAILIGKPGIGKTSIVEGLAYRLQRGLVPEALQKFSIINIKTPSLIGTLPNGETRLQSLVDELKTLDHVILFIDEIHMLIGATNESAMDFANMFKEGLGRGQIKVIGATTTEEYERYILRDKAFVRRFQSIEVLEPSREHTIKILMGTLPKIEKDTGAKMKYTTFIQSEIMGFITDITSEYKRVYGIGSRYPDICLTLLKEAFSQCIFDNRNQVTIFDVRDAIQNSKNIYPDVIRKELPNFDIKFKKIIDEEIADDASIDQL